MNTDIVNVFVDGANLTAPVSHYLLSSPSVDYDNPIVVDWMARYGYKDMGLDDVEIARRLFHFVRDNIAHSWDIQSRRVTKCASEALQFGEGICYAKSMLLAALLRAHGIPSGLCYQRLTLFDGAQSGFCLHALNTIYLRSLGRWIRVDARGNKPGVDAQFSLYEERLAFPVRTEIGEIDYATNYADPPLIIVDTLARNTDCVDMYCLGLPSEL